MTQFLNDLSSYSNLILAVITAVYAFLTWRMVSEMRVARESQTDANLIASPVDLGPISAQVRLQNAGPGPALNVSVTVSLEPPLGSPSQTWRHPALLAGQTEHFLIPGERIEALRDLAARHESLKIEVQWTNIFGSTKTTQSTHPLAALAEGWYSGGRLIPPDDIPTQITDVREELKKIAKALESIAHRLAK